MTEVFWLFCLLCSSPISPSESQSMTLSVVHVSFSLSVAFFCCCYFVTLNSTSIQMSLFILACSHCAYCLRGNLSVHSVQMLYCTLYCVLHTVLCTVLYTVLYTLMCTVKYIILYIRLYSVLITVLYTVLYIVL